MYQLTPTGPTWLLALHLLELVFWMCRVLAFMCDVKRHLEPHCNNILAKERNCQISSQR
jgi:hypothetical protein